MYDQYCDLVAGRKSDFTYEKEQFSVYTGKVGEVLITHVRENKKVCRAWIRRRQITCMMDIQGVACSLLHHKKDLWFDRHGELCTEEQYSPVITKEQAEEDYLDAMISSVMDMDTNDKEPNIQDFL